MSAIELKFKYEPQDWKKALRLYYQKTYHLRRDFFIGPVFLVFGIVGRWVYGASWVWTGLILASLVLILLVGYLYFLVPMRRFRSDPLLRQEYSLKLSEEGIEFRTAQSQSQAQWKLYERLWEDAAQFMLVYGKWRFIVIPKRVLIQPGMEEALRELLRKAIPKYETTAKT
ncbi:MAG: YcxB family protein [bacterium]